MHKVEFEIVNDDTLENEKAQLIDALKEEVCVKDLLQKYNLAIAVLNVHTYKIADYVERKKKCQGCQGLHDCRQPSTGYLLDLEYNDVFEKVLRPCGYQIKRISVLEHKQQFSVCDMSDEQLMLRFKDIKLEGESGSYLELVAQLIDVCDEDCSEGFYLCGEPGTGKTYLACCVANEMAKKGKRVAFVNVPMYISSLKGMMYDKIAYVKNIDALRKADVLILDDIAGESVSNWSRDEILLAILNERMEHKRFTLFTSNYDLTNLEKYYAQNTKIINDVVGAKRLVERVKALSTEKVLSGNNRRVKKK